MASETPQQKRTKKRKLRKLNPQQTSRKLTKLKYSNPIAYDIARKKEAKRSVVSGQSGLKPRSTIAKKGPSKPRTKVKSKLMAAKKYKAGAWTTTGKTGGAFNEKLYRTKKKEPTKRTNKYKSVDSAQGKKVKSQKNRWTSAGPNAVPAQGRRLGTKTVRTSARGGGAYAKGEGTQTSYTPSMQRAVRKAGTDRAYNRKLASGKSTYKRKTKKKDVPGSKSRAFRKRLGGY